MGRLTRIADLSRQSGSSRRVQALATRTSALVTDIVEPSKVAAREKLREMKATTLPFKPVVTSGWRPGRPERIIRRSAG
jgi:hypothetical protein